MTIKTITANQLANFQCRLTDVRRHIEYTRNLVTKRMKDMVNELKAKADDDVNTEDFRTILNDFADQVGSDAELLEIFLNTDLQELTRVDQVVSGIAMNKTLEIPRDDPT
jgi:hypothetical protein